MKGKKNIVHLLIDGESMFVVISYDIKDNKRRNKVCNELKNHGEHVQYSVFECNLSKSKMEQLQVDLDKYLNKSQDSMIYYFLCQKCFFKTIIKGRKLTEIS